MVNDSNASSLGSGLDALLTFVDKYDEFPATKANEICPIIVSKGLTARPSTVKIAKDLLLKFIEVINSIQFFNIDLFLLFNSKKK